MNTLLPTGVLDTNAPMEVAQSNERLGELEDEVQHLFEHVPFGSHAVDAQGVYLHINSNELAWLGYNLNEVVGKKSFFEFLTPSSQTVFRKHLPIPGLTNSVTDLELELLKRDGTSMPVSLNSIGYFDQDGKLLKRRELLFDLREVRQTKIRELVAAAAFDSVNGKFITDSQQVILQVNDAFTQITGYSSSEVVGRTSRLLNSGLHDAVFFQAMWAELNERGRWQGEIWNLRKDGTVFAEWLTISRVVDSFGAVTHYIGSFSDLTSAKTKAAELVVANNSVLVANIANAAKSSFLANMSHEIRTPLSAISGMAKLIQMEPLSITQTDRMKKLEVSVSHLSSIINDILDLSKIEAGRFVLEDVPVSIDVIVDHVVQMVRQRAEEKGLKFNARVDPMPDGLFGDPTRLTQALLNFAGNAIKFTETGTISITASILEDGVEDAHVKLEVEDTGAGIATDHLATLFQPFVQADSSTTRHHGGTGLGLAITKHLAEAMGGEVGLDSELGVGSKFWFTARLRKGKKNNDFVQNFLPEDAALTLKNQYSGRRILLAEDDEFNREIGQFLLQEVGLLVDLAEDGKEAVDMALRNHYDLVLMDMQMPKMDGLDATRFIRKAKGSSIPILAMTANAFVEDRISCLEAGMNEFITKPVDPAKLYQIILRELMSRD
jgi:PAS domain S-box-containing protein